MIDWDDCGYEAVLVGQIDRGVQRPARDDDDVPVAVMLKPSQIRILAGLVRAKKKNHETGMRRLVKRLDMNSFLSDQDQRALGVMRTRVETLGRLQARLLARIGMTPEELDAQIVERKANEAARHAARLMAEGKAP